MSFLLHSNASKNYFFMLTVTFFNWFIRNVCVESRIKKIALRSTDFSRTWRQSYFLSNHIKSSTFCQSWNALEIIMCPNNDILMKTLKRSNLLSAIALFPFFFTFSMLLYIFCLFVSSQKLQTVLHKIHFTYLLTIRFNWMCMKCT